MKRRYSTISLIGLLAAMTLIFLSIAPAQQKEPEVPYVSTPDEVVAEMLRIADVDKDDVLYDLGCGDGRIVITAAKMYGCRGVGIDINPERIRESRESAIKAGVSDKVQFIQMNLFEAENQGGKRRNSIFTLGSQPQAAAKTFSGTKSRLKSCFS